MDRVRCHWLVGLWAGAGHLGVGGQTTRGPLPVPSGGDVEGEGGLDKLAGVGLVEAVGDGVGVCGLDKPWGGGPVELGGRFCG